MNRAAFRWTRPLQFLGLALIAVLSLGTGVAQAQERLHCITDRDGCESCYNVDTRCSTWACPVGHPDGVWILCRGPS